MSFVEAVVSFATTVLGNFHLLHGRGRLPVDRLVHDARYGGFQCLDCTRRAMGEPSLAVVE
jgi:hypothetical protein